MNSQAIEDYLKAIYKLQVRDSTVLTSVLASYLQVSPPAATGMMKKLSASNLVRHHPYQGVELTDHGEKIALEVIRHHRLVELYLSEALGVPWDKVHDEAEKWEHILSEDLEDRIDEFLGYPTSDPHGAPIPNRNGTISDRDVCTLSKLSVGDKAVIIEVCDEDAEMLRYLGKLKLYPQTGVQVASVSPFDELMTICIDLDNDISSELVLGQKITTRILVSLSPLDERPTA